MNTCPNCDQSYDLAEDRPARFCPWCGADMPLVDGESWTTLLRLSSSAEAGFLAEQLERRSIETRLAQHDEFSAIDGTWQVRYLLLVHEEDAVEAARQIKHVLDAPESESVMREQGQLDGAQFDMGAEVADLPSGGLPWWAWAGVVLGALAVGGYFFDRQPADPPPPEPSNDEFLEALRVNGGRWVRPRTETTPAMSFYFDQRNHMWVLDEDLNGDQVPERRRKFQRGELV
ncbi:MAG: hypothetical protein WEA31_09845, partial [Pirellulales bacterium]